MARQDQLDVKLARFGRLVGIAGLCSNPAYTRRCGLKSVSHFDSGKSSETFPAGTTRRRIDLSNPRPRAGGRLKFSFQPPAEISVSRDRERLRPPARRHAPRNSPSIRLTLTRYARRGSARPSDDSADIPKSAAESREPRSRQEIGR